MVSIISFTEMYDDLDLEIPVHYRLENIDIEVLACAMKATELSIEIIISKLRHHTKLAKSKVPLVVGISGIQGSGKTTLVTNLQRELKKTPYNYSVGYFSLDDFYLTNKEQTELWKKNYSNKLLEFRGNPGTHDLKLLQKILDKLLKNTGETKIPIFDKSAFQGRGDRVPESAWSSLSHPVDLILIEGWMVGFCSLDNESLYKILSQSTQEDNILLEKLGSDGSQPSFRHHSKEHIQKLNDQLKNYQSIWNKLDLLIQLKPKKLSYVFQWRWEQELSSSKPGLTYEQVKEFVDRFMPAYELFLPRLILSNRPFHIITLDNKRSVQSCNQFPLVSKY